MAPRVSSARVERLPKEVGGFAAAALFRGRHLRLFCRPGSQGISMEMS